MTTFLQFALLGLGAGGAYAIAGIGLAQVYRGSGVLNLAHGATTFFSAVLFVWTYTDLEMPFAVAAAAAIAAAAALGVLVQVLVMHPLRSAPVLVRMIATLGVFAVVQQAVPLVFGSDFQQRSVGTFYPTGQIRFGDTVSLSYDRVIVVAVTVVLALVLRLLMDRTRFGLATTASAESPLIASTMGVNAERVAIVNWAIGSALAGLAGVLLIPIIATLTPAPLLLLVIPALAAAMIGGFSSYSLTVAGGLAIGIGQSLLTRYQADIFPDDVASGWPDALPFLVIIGVLVIGGTPFPRRGEVSARLPRIGRSTAHPLVGIAATAIAAAVVLTTTRDFAGSVTSVAALAIVGLSLVVITGLAGQTSLAQLSISGLAALVAARLSNGPGWPFLVVLAIGVVAGALAGLLFAIPAFRTRGPTLAIATLGVGIAIEQVVLKNGTLTSGGFGGTPIEPPTLFGLAINGVDHPQRYAAMVVVAFGLTAVAVSNLRASPTGRRLIATRSSERAASAVGISLSGAKAAAFVVAAAIAALGGVLMGFQLTNVTYQQYGLLSSLNLVIFTLIGGIGYVLGPLLGAMLSPSGIATYLFEDLDAVERWLVALSGVTLILTLISYPHGMAAVGERLRKLRPPRGVSAAADGTGPARAGRADGARLEVRALTVRYGPVVALHELHLTVEPGQIVGLIGPNGAGKTTAIDAISGFAPATSGEVRVGAVDVTGARPHVRAHHGLARSFQTVEPFDDMTVAENLAVAVECVRWWDWLGDLFRRRPVVLPDELRAEAHALGLTDLDAEPAALSQGQRRLLGVLRALAGSPVVLLLDEPAAGLDQAETEQLGQVLRHVACEQGVGLLLVEHDISLITSVCDRVVAIDFGRMIFDGTAQQALEDPLIRRAYLGELDEACAAEEEAHLVEEHLPS